MFKLQIVEAKRHMFPVQRKNKNGQVILDKETGEPKISMVPGGYRITFNDESWVSVTSGKAKSYDEDGKETMIKEHRFSVNTPGSPITDRLGRVIGQMPAKQVSSVMDWKQFVANYGRCGMPDLVLQGMMQADEELAEKRAARLAA